MGNKDDDREGGLADGEYGSSKSDFSGVGVYAMAGKSKFRRARGDG